MELVEAKSAAKALYLQAAALAGLEVSPDSPDRLADVVALNFPFVESTRRPEAVANLLRILAATIQSIQGTGQTMLHETNVEAGKKLCPVYPFGGKPTK